MRQGLYFPDGSVLQGTDYPRLDPAYLYCAYENKRYVAYIFECVMSRARAGNKYFHFTLVLLLLTVHLILTEQQLCLKNEKVIVVE